MWSKKIMDWVEDGTAFVSIPFTWNLPQAYTRCAFLLAEGFNVRIGGPAVDLMPDYVAGWDLDIATGGKVDALKHHNPEAVFTSRGCIRKCKFCAVPRIEGDLVELENWEPKPIICDNNILACSLEHFDKVVDSLKDLHGIDFNQGLDARLLTKYHANRLAELDLALVRLAWDHVDLEPRIMTAIEILDKAGIPRRKIRVYVLLGFNDTPKDAQYRLETLKGLKIRPNPQWYNPLDTLVKNSYVPPRYMGWTKRLLHRYMRYWSKQVWLEHIPFEEFDETR